MRTYYAPDPTYAPSGSPAAGGGAARLCWALDPHSVLLWPCFRGCPQPQPGLAGRRGSPVCERCRVPLKATLCFRFLIPLAETSSAQHCHLRLPYSPSSSLSPHQSRLYQARGLHSPPPAPSQFPFTCVLLGKSHAHFILSWLLLLEK